MRTDIDRKASKKQPPEDEVLEEGPSSCSSDVRASDLPREGWRLEPQNADNRSVL